MRKALIMLVLPAFLAGCAEQVFDERELGSASAAESLATDRCVATAQAEHTSMTAVMTCYLAGRRQFFTAIKLKKMDIFDAYSARVLLAAGAADRREVTPVEFADRIKRINADLVSSVLTAYQAQADHNARVAAAIQGLGEGLQQAGAAMRQPDSVNCTSIQTGTITNTSCR